MPFYGRTFNRLPIAFISICMGLFCCLSIFGVLCPQLQAYAAGPASKVPAKAGWVLDEDGDWHFFEKTDGDPYTGWLSYQGEWYYLDPDLQGAMRTGLFTVGRNDYIAAPSGIMYAGAWVDLDGSWYYAEDTGALKTKWFSDGGIWYWLQPDEHGRMASSQWLDDRRTKYYLNSSGAMATGWLKLEDGWHYFDGTSGVMQTGWLYDNGVWYWLQPRADGVMASDMWFDDADATYYFIGSGAMAIGWLQLEDGWYYFHPSGSRATRWVQDGGSWYWLQPDENGLMASSQWIDDHRVKYYLTKSGAMATGWLSSDDGWRYLDPASGALTSGWVQAGSWYYLDPEDDCRMVANATKQIKRSLYAFDRSGAMKAKCQVELDEGACGYASSSGAITKIGIFKNGKVVLQNERGKNLTGWQYLADTWFYGDAGGIMHTGWLQLGSTWYYMDPDGAMVTGSRNIDGKSYLFSSSGAWMPVNIVQDIHGQLAHGPKGAAYQKYIVLHDTEGGGAPQNVVAGWLSNGNLVAAHFVVGRDGTIVQCVPMDQIAHHAGFAYRGTNERFGIWNDGRDDMRGTSYLGGGYSDYAMNSWSIGIEMVHWDNVAYTEEQLNALDSLIAYIDGYYGFESTIIDHKTWNGNSDTSAAFAGYFANYKDHRTHN